LATALPRSDTDQCWFRIVIPKRALLREDSAVLLAEDSSRLKAFGMPIFLATIRRHQFLFPAQLCGHSPLQCRHVLPLGPCSDLDRRLPINGINCRGSSAPLDRERGRYPVAGQEFACPTDRAPVAPPLLGPDQYPAVFRRRRLSRPGLRFYTKFPGAWERGSSGSR